MSKIRQNLRLILDLEDLEKRVGDLENKAEIIGKIGRAVQDNATGNNTSSKGGGGSSNAGDGGVDGSGDSSVDPTGDGIRDGEDAFDNLKLGDRLDALTGLYDCETGEELSLSPNGNYIPPDDWYSADQKYSSVSFTAGIKWSVQAVEWYATGEQAGEAYLAVLNGITPGTTYSFLGVIVIDDVYFVQYQVTTFNGEPFTAPPFNVNVFRTPCTIGSEPSCPATAPSYGPWPNGMPTQLAWKNGKWVTNPNQEDAASPYNLNGQSSLDFCFGDDRHGTAFAANDGGVILMETDEAGTPISDGMHFNEDGVLNYTVNKNEVNRYKA